MGETENMFLTPPSSSPPPPPPPPFPSLVENTSLGYIYITEEKPPSPDPYGIGMENGNNFFPLPINISCDLPLLNLPKNTTLRRTRSSVNAVIAATVIPDQPSLTNNNTYTGNVAVTLPPPPPPVPLIELEAPLVPFPYPNSKQGGETQRPFELSTILVKPNKNIVRKLAKFAQKQGLLILGGAGIVSFVELFNDEDAPVAKTILHGTFHIILLDGCIVIPKNNSSKNEFSWLTIVVAGNGSSIIKGGPVKRLIAGSNVEIVVAPLSAFAAESSMTGQHYLRRPDLAHFLNHRDREWLTKGILKHIYKATLKELNNETNTAHGRR